MQIKYLPFSIINLYTLLPFSKWLSVPKLIDLHKTAHCFAHTLSEQDILGIS